MTNKINKCRICENEKLTSFFDLGNQPLANSLLKKQFEKEEKFPLSLSWCSKCSLVQLNHTIDPKKLFSNYVWVTSTSSSAKNYAQLFSQNIVTQSQKNDNFSYVLEIASNDGTFLKPFIEAGMTVLGVDPARNIVDFANNNGITTICGFWSQTIAEIIISEKGKPSIIFARNVLPHVANINDFVKAIRIAAKKDTLIAFEVHYAGKILNELHYDSIYHEHLCYFSLKSLEKILNKHEIFINDLFESPISGGSIVVLAGTYQREKSCYLREFEKKERLNQINTFEKWKEFSRLAYDHKKRLLDIINDEIKVGLKIAGYGASARSSTLLNFCEINSSHIKTIADMNYLKHNKYTAGSNILITPPGIMMNEKPDVIIILAWNFLHEITKLLAKHYNFSKKIIVPFPYPPKILNIQEVIDG